MTNILSKPLNLLLAPIEHEQLPALADIQISSLAFDSRAVKPGALFFAVRGSANDGRQFIAQAIAAGAAAIVAEAGPAGSARQEISVPVFYTAELRKRAADIARLFYDDPTKELLSVAITGTNGKTSVHWIVAEALRALHGATVQSGTLGLATSSQALRDHEAEDFVPALTTTPDIVSLYEFIRQANERHQLRALVSEVSSHALVQDRLRGVQWDAAVFTNLSRDHLDYHQTEKEYAEAKKLLFFAELMQSLKPRKVAILNQDDALGQEILAELKQQKNIRAVGFSTESAQADGFLCGYSGTRTRTEIELTLGGKSLSFCSRLIGDYNAVNNLTAATTLWALGFELEAIGQALEAVPPVPGRLECISGSGKTAYIDYAHTPDALVRVQQSLRPLVSGRLITVFGCGGDRDKGKRPLMGQVVAEQSDVAIVTSDNPRSEDPLAIIEDITPGMSGSRAAASVQVVPCRRSAIELALKCAQENDVVLIAGKGHEDYQEIEGVRHPFSDAALCRELLRVPVGATDTCSN